jgi:uncharacterized membrane protein YsdA (DUF1294 family)
MTIHTTVNWYVVRFLIYGHGRPSHLAAVWRTQEHVLVLSLLAISEITCEIKQRAG